MSTGKKKVVERDILDDDIDEQLGPAEGQARLYAVPRNHKCTSEPFIDYINYFGNE